jgi:hypothetical protein
MARRMVVGMITILAVAACGSVHRLAGPSDSGPQASGTATVSGHVYWPSCPSGGPGCPTVEGVPVHFSWAPDQLHVMATSDASGTYSIQLRPGTYVVIAGHADRSSYEQRVTVKDGDRLTLNLPVSPSTGRA